MNKVVGCNSELKSLGDNFLDEFAKGVKKDYGTESFRVVIGLLVQFRDDDSGGNLEVFRPMS